SDPGVYQKYQSKPPLCNMDGKERGPFQTFGKTNGKNIFEQFEESKRKAKEKYESIDKDFFDNYGSTIFKDAELTDLKSNVQLLVKSMDAMKSQQCKKHLELSEKLTWLSNSIKSSEDKILSEIHNLNYVSKPALHLKENTTQTSPVQNLPAEEHIASQYKTRTRTCLDGPAPSQSSAQNTCNLYLTGLKGRPTHSAQSVSCTGNSCIAMESPEGYLGSNTGGRRIHFSKGDAIDDRTVKSVCSLQHFYHNDLCVPRVQDHLLQHTELNGKENSLIACRSVAQTPGKQKANKRRKNSKNRKALSNKNTTQVIPRAVAGKSQDKSKNEPVTHKLGNFVRQTENCFTLHSESCESSLPVIPALVRKAKKKNSLKYSPLITQQTVMRSAKKETSNGNRDSFFKTEDLAEDSDLSIWDSNPLNYCTDSENNVLWFAPASPPLNNASTNLIIQKQHQDLISVFFDSSDDSN
ncbi:uncharacterized protein, partial [Pyxicephalus adspersus]|uniref:uncharacterized protein n=1 Tax=Pyxicephalus adspersus TaxID=30357 RepID=UPI003B59BDF2